ncbi:uncharacterized protein LOC134762818 [Penaeus indicus]|uniref:uncharacterized protein LOC134762818 n=1 Tax=Penaeus indicus TaxID=29960 RepID=UPI00300D450C
MVKTTVPCRKVTRNSLPRGRSKTTASHSTAEHSTTSSEDHRSPPTPEAESDESSDATDTNTNIQRRLNFPRTMLPLSSLVFTTQTAFQTSFFPYDPNYLQALFTTTQTTLEL